MAAKTYGVLLASWVGCCLPFEIMDRFRLFAEYKIQDRPIDPRHREIAFRMAALNWTWLPFALLFASPLLAARFPEIELSAQSMPWSIILLQFITCFIVDDLCFYFYHRALHEIKPLYIRFHKPHHIFTAPFVWTSHAVHPVEMLLQAVGTMLGPICWSFSSYGMPAKIYWAWLAIRQLQGVLDHTGYHFKLDPLTWIPGCGGTKFHDDHHKYFVCNYASAFSAIDHFFGTTMEAKQAAGLLKISSKTP